MSKVESARILASAGLIHPVSPVKLARAALELRRWGLGFAGGFAALEARSPNAEGLVDEIGPLTFGQMGQRANAVADHLKRLGVRPGHGVAIMCRNHRGFVDASLATAKAGADLLLLNTAFAGRELSEVLAREKPAVLIYDQEFEELLSGIVGVKRVVAWVDGDTGAVPTLEQFIATGSTAPHHPPPRPGRIVILTSGTSGTPKGAPRREASIDAAVALLSRIPLRRGWRVHIAAPLFHAWGLAHLLMAILMETSAVLTRRFDPEECLRLTSHYDCDELVVIPVMLQRMLALPQPVKDRYDLGGLKVVASSGSALPGDLGVRWMNQFGDNLYNAYGSTEVAYAAIATPDDLRRAPGTAGRPPAGTVVRLFDVEDRPTRPGEAGRIFVGNGMLFEGYSGGGGKQVIDGLMCSGDVGRFDAAGRLFVEGRDDEMITSGGENVFPQEIEDCLARHPAVAEVAAIGVDDDEFGKCVRAFVVLKPSGSATEQDLKQHVRDHLARFKVPREIVFLDELPHNATGKLLKRELRDPGREPS